MTIKIFYSTLGHSVVELASVELDGTFHWWALTPTENEQPMSSNMEAQLQRTSQQQQSQTQGTSPRNQRAGKLNFSNIDILKTA